MNRKSFLKKLGIGVTAVVVAPKVIAEIHPSEDELMQCEYFNARIIDNRPLSDTVKPPYWDALYERYGNMSMYDFCKSVES